jgi:2-polyprenyl-6-methoxyphenol hydroxylase-like FAD-dependent oxidoreductase
MASAVGWRMRKIAIVGAGQGGLVLGHALLAHGYHVTIVTNRQPADIAAGRILSNQCMWHDALEIERSLGLALWDDRCPPIPGFDTAVLDTGGRVQHRFIAPLSHPGQSIDQRLKFPTWIELFIRKGGSVEYLDVEFAVLEQLTAENDLVVLAAGRGKHAMKGYFETDASRTISQRPERQGASIHVTGREPDRSHTPELEGWVVIPQVGEFWIIPTLTVHGPGHIVCLQGVPGGPLDTWSGLKDGPAHLETMLAILRTWLPEEAERCRNIRLVDPLAWLSGGAVSTVTHPVQRLPSGRYVVAMGDSFVLNDPISQQGSNNATHAAYLYAQQIVARNEKPFDAAWMTELTEQYWNYARWSVELTRLYLTPTPAFHHCFKLAATSPETARSLADSNNDVSGFLKALPKLRPAASGETADEPSTDLSIAAPKSEIPPAPLTAK